MVKMQVLDTSTIQKLWIRKVLMIITQMLTILRIMHILINLKMNFWGKCRKKIFYNHSIRELLTI